MPPTPWSRHEVELIVDDYLAMLTSHLAGVHYSKAAHRRALLPLLNGRSPQSIEFKHCNISAALINAGMPPLPGYLPRWNYQALLEDVIEERMGKVAQLHVVAAADADAPVVVPEVDDILAILAAAPSLATRPRTLAEPRAPIRLPTNYLEREARNRSLGESGELLVLNYERARLLHAGKDSLADKVEHTSKVRGDHAGYDILSFEVTGAEKLIEVKTTKYGVQTPFFVSNNEVLVSERHTELYHVYRLYDFRQAPRLYTLPGAISHTCQLAARTWLASPY